MEQNGNWYAMVAPDNNYLYNGKELNRDFDINLYEYGARWYDPALSRWTSVDPLAETMSNWSPYNYTFGNPILLRDLFGLAPYYDWNTGTYKEEDGSEVSWGYVQNWIDDGGTTIDVHLVNDLERSKIGVADFGNIAVGAQKILSRNGIEGNLNFHMEDIGSMQQIPNSLTFEDRELFLTLTNNRFNSIGASAIHETQGSLDTWFSYENKVTISSGIDVSDFLLGATGGLV